MNFNFTLSTMREPLCRIVYRQCQDETTQQTVGHIWNNVTILVWQQIWNGNVRQLREQIRESARRYDPQ